MEHLASTGYSLTVADPLRPPLSHEVLNYVLVERLLETLSSCFTAEPTPPSTSLLNVAFQAVLDTCSLDPELWNKVCSQTDIRSLVQKLLLNDPRDVVRKSAASVIGEKIARSVRYGCLTMPYGYRTDPLRIALLLSRPQLFEISSGLQCMD